MKRRFVCMVILAAIGQGCGARSSVLSAPDDTGPRDLLTISDKFVTDKPVVDQDFTLDVLDSTVDTRDLTVDIWITPTLVCGNSIREPGEACDDGNTKDGDECSANCRLACIGGRTFKLRCYVVIAESKAPVRNWAQGLSYCKSLGMHYASISSSEENQFLEKYRDSVASAHWLWIGFNDIAAEGNWVWQNGEPVVFTNWKGGEPNNMPPSENCGCFRKDQGRWYDFPCEAPGPEWVFAAACEKK
ncbi:MAG: lectin-like protein [Pseudomonadota bacterium]